MNDPDIVFTADVTEIGEGQKATVTITATRGDTSHTAAAVDLTAAFAGQDGNTADAEFTVVEGTNAANNSQTFSISAAAGAPSVEGTLEVVITALQETAADANDDGIVVTLTGGSGDHFPADGITITIVDDDKS